MAGARNKQPFEVNQGPETADSGIAHDNHSKGRGHPFGAQSITRRLLGRNRKKANTQPKGFPFIIDC